MLASRESYKLYKNAYFVGRDNMICCIVQLKHTFIALFCHFCLPFDFWSPDGIHLCTLIQLRKYHNLLLDRIVTITVLVAYEIYHNVCRPLYNILRLMNYGTLYASFVILMSILDGS